VYYIYVFCVTLIALLLRFDAWLRRVKASKCVNWNIDE